MPAEQVPNTSVLIPQKTARSYLHSVVMVCACSIGAVRAPYCMKQATALIIRGAHVSDLLMETMDATEGEVTRVSTFRTQQNVHGKRGSKTEGRRTVHRPERLQKASREDDYE